MTSIVLTYAFNHKDKDSLLLYLPATKKQTNDQDTDFLAVEMVNRQIRFLWNAGGGTTVLTHPLKLQASHDDLSDDSRWYRIEADRSGNVGHLKVRPMKSDDENEAATDGVTVSQAGPAKFTKIDVMTGDRLFIGRAPDSPPAELKVNSSYYSFQKHKLTEAFVCRRTDSLATSTSYGSMASQSVCGTL